MFGPITHWYDQEVPLEEAWILAGIILKIRDEFFRR